MTVSSALANVRERIADAALRRGRAPRDVALVGCKPASVEQVLEAAGAGLLDIGENRVQEAAAKVPQVAARYPAPVRWHLIGHLQSNKVRAALELFQTIHSVDRPEIAAKLSKGADGSRPVYLEVQFAPTPGRVGFSPDTVVAAFDTIAALPNLKVSGLMTVAPLGLDEVAIRRVFRMLREIRDRIQDSHAAFPSLGLSMGMTEDYEIAIEEGATVVRIGRAIFAA